MKRLAVVTLAASLLLPGFGGCGPPQIGADRDVFKNVDALYTAVSLRDPALLDRCAGKLRALRDAGKLPPAAGRSLEGIVAEARGGKWERAQSRLGDFMLGQTR